MAAKSLSLFLFAGALAAAFLLGRGTATPDASGANELAAQGRQPIPTPGGTGGRTNAGPAPTPIENRPDDLVYLESGSGGGAAEDLIAVTGSYGVGTSVLYVLDAKKRQLAVYEARGGTKSMRRLVFVGARRIDLDLELTGFNDESEFDWEELKSRFDQRQGPVNGKQKAKDGGSGR